MIIDVQLMGQLRGMIAQDQLELELPDAATVQDAVRELAANEESARLQFLTEQGEIRPSLLLVINDHAIPARQASSIVLTDRDQLTILPPISGG